MSDVVTPESERLRYLRVAQIRSEICTLVGIDTDRYDGARHDVGLTKEHVQLVANELGTPPEGVTLAELYPWLCEQVGTTYNATAGMNEWGLGRTQLKAIHAALRGRDSS